jgi:hypothetical protein
MRAGFDGLNPRPGRKPEIPTCSVELGNALDDELGEGQRGTDRDRALVIASSSAANPTRSGAARRGSRAREREGFFSALFAAAAVAGQYAISMVRVVVAPRGDRLTPERVGPSSPAWQ